MLPIIVISIVLVFMSSMLEGKCVYGLNKYKSVYVGWGDLGNIKSNNIGYLSSMLILCCLYFYVFSFWCFSGQATGATQEFEERETGTNGMICLQHQGTITNKDGQPRLWKTCVSVYIVNNIMNNNQQYWATRSVKDWSVSLYIVYNYRLYKNTNQSCCNNYTSVCDHFNMEILYKMCSY